MRAVLFDHFGMPATIEQVPDPTPTADGAVLRVAATGVCRSDWHGWMGHDGDITPPHVPGHEFAGEVVAVGADVARCRVGDRITVPFVCGCGRCPECAAGDHQVCRNYVQPGFTHWGSFAEFVAIERVDVNLVRLPDSVDDAAAASLGCRFATAFRAVVDQGRVAPGEWVAVYGCGGVGLSAVMIAVASGARVVAVDVSDGALAIAERSGASVVVNANRDDSVEAVRAATGGGAHLSLDAFGHPETMRNSILGLRRRGRHVQAGLLLGDHAAPSVPMALVVAHELEILGTHGMAAHRYPAMLEMVTGGTLRPDRLVTGSISLDDAPAALTAMSDGSPTGITMITEF